MFKKVLPVAAIAIGLVSGMAVSPLRADESDKKTTITTKEPIDVQGTVLQPGTYVLKVLDSNSQSDIVQVFDGNERHLITTVIAMPAYRPDPPDHTDLRFYENPANQPVGLRTWFYPGDNYGFEFRNVTGH
jgi:hypothetical protein